MLKVRDGVPNFACRLRDGEGATIVAYGTSLTYGGQYLARVMPALQSATGNANLRLVNSGLRGYPSLWAAFRVRHDVLPHDPDLVFLEFAHNDGAGDALKYCVPALEGIIAQIRAARPDCDIVFVYLAEPGTAVDGPTEAMRLHEEVAEYYGFPSIDLATLVENLVARGVADWESLTVDGVHHAAAAEGVLGVPFADALVELVQASTAARPPLRPSRDLLFANAWRAPASQFIVKGNWGVGPFDEREPPIVEAYVDDVAVATEPGAVLRMPFAGRWVFAWALGNGELTGELTAGAAGAPKRFHGTVDAGDRWKLLMLFPRVAPDDYVLELTVTQTPVVFGDVFFVGV